MTIDADRISVTAAPTVPRQTELRHAPWAGAVRTTTVDGFAKGTR
jgi:hypothetical protein